MVLIHWLVTFYISKMAVLLARDEDLYHFLHQFIFDVPH